MSNGDRFRRGSLEWRREHDYECEVGDPFELDQCECPLVLCLPHQCDAWTIGTTEDALALVEDLKAQIVGQHRKERA